MIKRLWLLFAQITTVLLAGIFVVATLKPHWLGGVAGLSGLTHPQPLVIEQAENGQASLLQSPVAPPASSLREAAARAMPQWFTSSPARSRKSPFILF